MTAANFPHTATLTVELEVGSSLTADREAVAVDRQYRWRVEADVEARAEPATAVVAEFLNPSGAWCPVRNIETCARLLAITPTIAAPSAALDFDLFAGPLPATTPRPRLKGTGPRSLNRDDAAVAERDNRRVMKGGR